MIRGDISVLLLHFPQHWGIKQKDMLHYCTKIGYHVEMQSSKRPKDIRTLEY